MMPDPHPEPDEIADFIKSHLKWKDGNTITHVREGDSTVFILSFASAPGRACSIRVVDRILGLPDDSFWGLVRGYVLSMIVNHNLLGYQLAGVEYSPSRHGRLV